MTKQGKHMACVVCSRTKSTNKGITIHCSLPNDT